MEDCRGVEDCGSVGGGGGGGKLVQEGLGGLEANWRVEKKKEEVKFAGSRYGREKWVCERYVFAEGGKKRG